MTMKQLFLAFVASVLAVMLSSCLGGGEYEVCDDVVLYSYWTFSFGQRADTLPGADPATFKQVRNWLGHDSERVYYKKELVPGVDVPTLKVDRKPLFHDKKDYYYETKPLHVADMSSFKIIKWVYDSFWAKDSRYAYFNDRRFEVDLPTFKVESSTIAKDKDHVYYFGNLIPDADPKTFEAIGKSGYYRDKSHIWCGDELLEDVDYETFQADDFDTGHDKYGRFRYHERDTIEPGVLEEE